MLQPLLVRCVAERYQLISGERRLRAAIKAGWEMVPAQVREADDRLVAELAIVENLQRKDLNPIEKALSFKRYLDQHHCTQEELAQRLKIDRSTIANLMRLLELPESVVDSVRRGDLTAGHARALLPLGDEHLQTEIAGQLGDQQWSVRETERQVQERIREEDSEPLQVVGGAPKEKPTRSEQLASLEQELRIALGTRVDLRQSAKGRGKIVIQFNNHEEFERLRQLLTDTASVPHSEAG
jgi:ParB family chromosome partitioning protein